MLVGLPRERERPACGELEKRTVEGNCSTIFKFYLQLLFPGEFRRTVSRNVKSDIAFCVENVPRAATEKVIPTCCVTAYHWLILSILKDTKLMAGFEYSNRMFQALYRTSPPSPNQNSPLNLNFSFSVKPTTSKTQHSTTKMQDRLNQTRFPFQCEWLQSCRGELLR